MRGRSRCYSHGGESLTGIAHPAYVDGRYATSAPARLAAALERSFTDPDVLKLTSEIALVDARLADLLGRVDSGESGATWKELHTLWRLFGRARGGGDRDKMAELLTQLGDTITKGQADHAAWAEIGVLLDRRQRLVESERKREESAEQILTVDEVKLVLRRVLDAVQQHVTDPRQLNAIGLEISRLAVVESGVGVVERGKRRAKRHR